tara:strand:+ start:1262 stop:1507 length:246 start_codon:yes stop_codon:yes gene_type:complete
MSEEWLKQDLLTYELARQGELLKEAHLRGMLDLSNKDIATLREARDLMETLAEQAREDLAFAKEVEPNPVLWFRQHYSDWW